MFKAAAAKILDAVFPAKCVSCGLHVETSHSICPSCWKKIKFIADPLCETCGYPFEYKIEGQSLCGECIIKTPRYEKARSVFVYDENSKHLITGFKYSDQTWMAPALSKLMLNSGAEIIEDSEIIIPVPLHRNRLISRRFNQSAMLSNFISKKTKLPVSHEVLVRLKNTPNQAGLKQKERLKNIKNAFRVKNPEMIAGKNILLVDDVMTTGATASECTKTLLLSGAKKVNVLTVGRIFLQ